MNHYIVGGVIGAVIALAYYSYSHDVRLRALESKATAPAMNATQPSPSYQGEFAAERIAGRVRTHCEWKERTERTASLHCVYVKPNGKK